MDKGQSEIVKSMGLPKNLKVSDAIGFGTKTEHSLNQNVHSALIKHGFVNENNEILYPFKLTNFLFFDENLKFETFKKLVNCLSEGLKK